MGFLIDDKSNEKHERKTRFNTSFTNTNTSFELNKTQDDLLVNDFCKYLEVDYDKYNSDQILLLLTGILKIYKGDDIPVQAVHTVHTVIKNQPNYNINLNNIEATNEDINLSNNNSNRINTHNQSSNRSNDVNQIRLKKLKYKKTNSEIREKNNNGIVPFTKNKQLQDKLQLQTKLANSQSLIRKLFPEFNHNNFYFTPKSLKVACSQFLVLYTNRSNHLAKIKSDIKNERIRQDRERYYERATKSKSPKVNDNPVRFKAAENYRERCYEVFIYFIYLDCKCKREKNSS